MDELPTIAKSMTVFRFDPHPRRKQVVIFGQVSTRVVRHHKVLKEFSQSFKKSVKLVGLSPSSRIDAIVNDIIQQCPYIEGNNLRTSLLSTVKEVQNREYDANGITISSLTAPDGSYLPRFLEIFDCEDNKAQVNSSSQSEMETGDIWKLGQYVEMLYDDIPSKIEGVRLISLLSKSNRYLLEISEHASASNAIFRTLRENNRTNMDLTFYILTICLNYAKIQWFHRYLIRHKLPQLVLDIIDFELERCEKWKTQLVKRKEAARLSNSAKSLEEYSAVNQNFQAHMERQNSILTLAFDIIHYLSEDRNVAVGLIHQGVVTSLTDALERNEFMLWEVVIAYLKNMSNFKEYVTQMINVNALGKLAKILKGKTPIPIKVARVCFGLLCNLSFSMTLKNEMIQLGILTVLARCISKSSFSDVISKTLYIMSMDPLNRVKIAESGAVEFIMDQLIPDTDTLDQISRIKGALAVNIAKDPIGAKIIGNCKKLTSLVKHSIKNQDTLGIKIIRNVVETTSSTTVDQQAGHLAKAIVEVNSLDFALECVGTLACLNVSQFPELIKTNRLAVWFKRQLMNYMNMTNMASISYQLKTAALEVTMLLTHICKTEEGARFITGEGFVDQICIRLLHACHTDPQIIQQIVYLFNVCVQHESVATFLVTKTQFPQELLAFTLNIGGALRKDCDNTLHRLGEFDETWREIIIEHEFLIYNEKWTTAITETCVDDFSSGIPSLTTRDPINVQHLNNLGKENSYFRQTNGFVEDFGQLNNVDFTIDMMDDSSTTDDDSTSFSLSQSESGLLPDVNPKCRSSNDNFFQLFQEDMANSQEWQFFLNEEA